MNLDDIKEKLIEQFKILWEQIQESSLYNRIKDRYDNLSPFLQKLVVLMFFLLVSVYILSYPYGYLSNSGTYVDEFLEKKQIIADLLKVTREASQTPQVPPAPPLSSIGNMIEKELEHANLLPEQKKGVAEMPTPSNLIPENLMAGTMIVTLEKLNIRQVVDIGYAFQSFSPSVKLKDLSLVANKEDSRYFDVIYKMTSLAVPELSMPEEEEPKEKVKRPKNTKASEEEEE